MTAASSDFVLLVNFISFTIKVSTVFLPPRHCNLENIFVLCYNDIIINLKLGKYYQIFLLIEKHNVKETAYTIKGASNDWSSIMIMYNRRPDTVSALYLTRHNKRGMKSPKQQLGQFDPVCDIF